MTDSQSGDQSVSGSFVVGDVVLVRDVSGNVTIVTTQRPPYRVETYPTSALPLSVQKAQAQPVRLLQTRYAAVPFAGREATLNDLSTWLGEANAVSVRLENADRVLDDHRTCHPPTLATTVFEPLHPDRLGEDFLALIDPRNPYRHNADWLSDDWTVATPRELLTKAVNGNPPVWTPAVMATLVETARRWPHIAAEVLYPLVRDHPELAIAAGGATLARMATLDDIDAATLSAIDALLPTDRHVDLDIAAAAVSAALTPHRLATTTSPGEQAQQLATHAWRLSNAGRRDEALTRTEESHQPLPPTRRDQPRRLPPPPRHVVVGACMGECSSACPLE